MKKCKDCANFVHNPPIFDNEDGKCEKDGNQHWENQDRCTEFEERKTEKE